MNIHLKCFSKLADRYACDYQVDTRLEIGEGATVAKVMRATGIDDKEVKIVFVNGQKSDTARPLIDGDRVALVPATGGM
jgi:sulfur carrier protein ThiS